MTRIIFRRCFLLLAFTGILSSQALEPTPGSSTGIPDNDSTEILSVGTGVFSITSAPKSNGLLSGAQESSLTTTSHSDPGSSSTVPPHSPAETTQHTSAREGSSLGEPSRSTEEPFGSNPEHSDGLFRDEALNDSEIASSSGTFTENDPAASSSHVTYVRQETTPHEVTETSAKDAVDESTHRSSSDHPAPSTVPSMDSRSSSAVGRDQTTQVGTVQSDGLGLNATRATTEGDAVGITTSPTGEEYVDDQENHMVSITKVSMSILEGKSSKIEEMVEGVTRDMDSAASSPDVAAVHSERDEHLMLDVTRASPMSPLVALSISEDSIHPHGSTAQTLEASTAPLESSKPSEREQEFPDFHPESSESLLVTFDPDGMTHNSSQDPDAVTFTPVTFHVDGISTEGRLSTDVNRRPSVLPSSIKFTDETTHVFELLEREKDREREPLSPANNGQSPLVEPDREELSSKNTFTVTKQPVPPPVPTGVVLSANDESEEMMNDSPQFGPIQSKPTSDKELEESVSNDISTGASPPLTKATNHELESSTDHQSEQSEFRPFTAATRPSKSPDSSSSEQQPQAPFSTRPSQTESVSSTSPTSLVPSHSVVTNQSVDAVTDGTMEGGNRTTAAATSSIAGVAVKTSVSVSLPLSKTPLNATVDADDAIFPNISGILPFPIHLDHKEPVVQTPVAPSTTDAPSTTPSVGGLRIRKPKLKIGGTEGPSESSDAPRTRKPFLAPPPRSSSTVGPPVSIFKKSKTRVASITSSTTARPFPQFSTIRVHYASRMPGVVPELVFSMEPVTTTVPTTTETEEPFSDEPFTDPTQGPIVPPNDDDITLIKVAGCLTVDKGLLWHEQLNNRHSPIYREKANYVQIQMERLFRTSPIASQVWKIQIDGFSGRRGSKSVVIDFFLYLIKSRNEISTSDLTLVFHDKLINNTFNRFTVDPSKTTFEFLNEEPMRPPTEAPESSDPEPVLPQWAIAVIVVGAASLIFIVLFAVVAILGRHHMRRRYSSKLNDELDSDRPGDWETKMAAAYENLAADTIYDAEDLPSSNTYKKKHNATYHGRPSKPQRADSWSSSDWSPPPRRPRPQVHRIVY